MSKTEKYFGKNGSEWVSALYKDTGKSIPEIRANKVLDYFDKSCRDLDVCIDVGCGDGRFLASLQSEVCCYGLDFSLEMLSSAKERLSTLKNVELVQVDLNTEFSIALASVSADLISLLGIIHYLESPVNCLTQCAKLLKSKGVVAVTFRNRWFNLQARSKYSTSPLTIRDRTNLEFEVAQFESKGLLESKDGCWGIDLNEETLKYLDSVVESANPNGINDDYWNPNCFEYWRQFSPVDCIKLGADSGLRCIALAPIDSNEHARLETCTVFVAIFESIL